MRNERSGAERIPTLPARTTIGGEIIPLQPQSPNFEEVILQSTSLIDESAKHLFERMISSSQNNGPVKDTVELAKQIANLARTKLDLVKAIK